MATYFVASGGSNTAPYDTWAKAATSLATALAAATSTGDIVVIQYDAVPSGDAEVAADATYSAAANIALVSASNDGGSSYTLTEMGTSNWIGNSTTNRSVSLAGAFNVFVYGLTLRTAGSTSDSITIANSDGAHFECDSCYLWHGNTATASRIVLGTGGNGVTSFVSIRNSTLRLGSTSQSIQPRGNIEILNCSVSSAGSLPTTLISDNSQSTGNVEFVGCDFSYVTTTLVGDFVSTSRKISFTQCKLGSGVVVLATQTAANKSAALVYVFDCASGGQHYHFQYHDAFGSLTTDTGIYANDNLTYDGTNKCSWKIVTTANCSYYTPFVTPWMSKYNSATSAVTPSWEILRDGSTTAYQDDEVWGEWMYKGTTGSTKVSFVNDKRSFLGTPTNQASGVGTSGWTGEGGSAWSGKLAPSSTITPAEIGDISARLYVGEPSITVYSDPQIRGV